MDLLVRPLKSAPIEAGQEPLSPLVPPTAFDPPADYQFEPEFQAPIPRPIPPRARQGRHEQIRARSCWAVLAIGFLAVLLDELPGVQRWANFFPPLDYLQWFGAGAMALAAWGVVFGFIRFRVGPYRYIRYGIPLVARVTSLVKTPVLAVHGHVTHYAITALIQFRDPHTGEIRSHELKSRDFAAMGKDDYTTSFQVGDYVTAVYFPRKFPKSLRLFAFLDVVPGLGVVRIRPGWSKTAVSRAILRSTIFLAFLAVLLSGLCACRLYQPLSMDWRHGILPVLLGGIGYAAIHVAIMRYRTRERQLIVERNARAMASGEALEIAPAEPERSRIRAYAIGVFVFAIGLMIGGYTVLCWCFAVNAWLDGSQPALKPAEIRGVKTLTYEFVFREYVVEYSLRGVEDRLEYSTTPEHAAEFLQIRDAIAEVHAGRFGWPWVKRLDPAVPGK
jgi:hypothetical protein